MNPFNRSEQGKLARDMQFDVLGANVAYWFSSNQCMLTYWLECMFLRLRSGIHASTLRPIVASNITWPLPPTTNVNISWRAAYKLYPMISLIVFLIFIFHRSQSKGLVYFKAGYVHNISVAKNADGTIMFSKFEEGRVATSY